MGYRELCQYSVLATGSNLARTTNYIFLEGKRCGSATFGALPFHFQCLHPKPNFKSHIIIYTF
jgi:hypothetical protein